MAIALADSAAARPRVRRPSPHWRGLVVVLVPPIDDDVMRNALARVSGELAAAPFKTITAPIDPDGDVMAQVETRGQRPGRDGRVRDRARPRSGLAARDDLGVEPRQRHDDHAAHAGRGRQRRSGGGAAGRRDGRAGARQPGGAVAVAGRRRSRRPRSSRSRPSARPARLALAVGVGLLAISATRPTSGRRRSRRRTAARRHRRAPVGERARPGRRRLVGRWAARASSARC